MANWIDAMMQNVAQGSPQTQADIANTNAVTQGQQLSNQQAALRLELMRRYLSGAQSPGDNTSAVAPAPDDANAPPVSGDLNVDSARARSAARQAYAPVPAVWTQQDMASLNAATMSGIPGAREAALDQHDKRFESLNAQRSYMANQQYNDAYAVATAPDGQAMAALENLNDPVAQTLARQYKAAGLTDDQVKQHAAQLASITYQEARLPVQFKDDGVARDSEGREIPGYHESIGLSPQQIAEVKKDGLSMVDGYDKDGRPTKIEKFRKAGFGDSGIDAYVQSVVQAAQRRGTLAGPAPTAPPQGAQPPPGAPPGAQPPPGAAPGAPPQQPAPNAPAQPAGQVLARGALASPNAKNAGGVLDFSDAKDSPLKNRPAAGLTEGENSYTKDEQTMDKQAGTNVNSARFTIMEGQNILSILPKATVGPGSAEYAKLQTALEGLFGNRDFMENSLSDAGARQALEKLLGQDAIASTEKEMKDSGGGQIRGGAQLMGLAMQKLNASPDMARSAIAAITKYNMSQAQYDAQMWGADYLRYRRAGKDVNAFQDWYGTKYPKDQVVKPVTVEAPPKTAAASNQSYPRVNGAGDTLMRDAGGNLAYVSSDKKRVTPVGPQQQQGQQ